MTSLMVAAAGLVLAPVASAHGKHEMKKPAPKAKHHAAKPKHYQEHRHEHH